MFIFKLSPRSVKVLLISDYVMMTNNGLSRETPNKRPMEIGSTPKYKPRKVSAVRDFPPGCGPNAMPVDLKFKENISVKEIEAEGQTMEGLNRAEKVKPVMVVGGGSKLVSSPKGPIGNGSVKLGTSFGREDPLLQRQKSKAVAKRSKIERVIFGGPSMKKKAIPVPSRNSSALILRGRKSCAAADEDRPSNSRARHNTPHDFDVNLPPKHSSHGDARNRVIETLKLFHSICRKLSQNEGRSEKQSRRIDFLAAKIIKDRKMEVNTGKKMLGDVPGVEVGDEFQYRVELSIVGIHRPPQAGIDSMKYQGIPVANSIVDAGVYSGDKHKANVLTYSGCGGNVVGKNNKQPEDQKLERGNLALKNSISVKNPVRVIRGRRETNSRGKVVTTYVYDGLYTVDRYWQERGPHGKLVYMFELRRIPGQPELRNNN